METGTGILGTSRSTAQRANLCAIKSRLNGAFEAIKSFPEFEISAPSFYIVYVWLVYSCMDLQQVMRVIAEIHFW